jgi:type IV secretory pathway VirB2 component (pilin)
MPFAITREPVAPSVRLSVVRAALLMSIAMLLVLIPEWAFAQAGGGGLDSKAKQALDWIQTAVYTILVISVMGSGVLAAFGRMSWSTVGQVLVGAIVAGMATEVVTALYGKGGG